ncbi:hypothetical protein OIU84_023905, partial [Salix udensis]
MADDEYAPLSGADPGSFGKILLSDVVVRRRRRVFWGRKWNSLDIENAVGILAMHVLCFCAPFYFTWTLFWVAYGLSVVTGLGITLSYHRNLSHRSFKLPKWLEYFFAYCGVQALQRDPIYWVSIHRHHHQFCDSERDPHSPTEGFWFSHMFWLFDANYITEKCGGPSNVEDLEKQPFYKFMQDTYFLHPIAFGVLLYAGGISLSCMGNARLLTLFYQVFLYKYESNPTMVAVQCNMLSSKLTALFGELRYHYYGSFFRNLGVRIVLVFHITWLVNSVSHIWGKQAWNTGDLSRNNWWLALLTIGEGWHNNHHAFAYSAKHGLEWWQIDITWYVIRFLQAIGLATDLK